jgi:biuret amidohydrolase
MSGIDVSRTALIVMDFQNDIIHPDGAFGGQGAAEQVANANAVPNTAKALAAARKAGMTVVHIGVSMRPGHPEISNVSPLFQGIKQANALVEGTWGVEFHPDLAPAEGEVVAMKPGVSSFAGTDVDLILRNRGIDRVVLAGIATTFVVEGTARHAADLGYGVTVLEDCCASMTDEMHQASIVVLSMLGGVSSSAEFAGALG